MVLKHFDLQLEDAHIIYYPSVFSSEISWSHYNTLLNETPWQDDEIKLFGKVYKQPRRTALYANNSKSYSYSNIIMHPHAYTETLKIIKEKVELITREEFTTCLLNLYRDGKDSNGWHADNEKELGTNPSIASVSFGAERLFHLKHRRNKTLKHKLILEHGSLLVMKGETQHHWLHQLPKTKRGIRPRINLTFRYIK